MSKSGRNTNKRLPRSAFICLCAFGGVALWSVVAIIVELFEHGKAFSFALAFLSGLADYRVWVIFLCAVAGVVILFVAREMRSGRRVLKINDIEDSRWMTTEDVRKSENMTLTTYDKLSSVADGIPVYAQKQGNRLAVVLAKGMHTLTVGTTRSGKTTCFVGPTIQILCRTKTKPSIVMTDPKGELFRNHAATLKSQGYNVIVIDVSDPYRSARWNPFAAVIKKTERIREAQSTALFATTVEQRNGKYIDVEGVVYDTYELAQTANVKRGQYAFDGQFFDSYEKADNARKVFIQDLTDEIFVDIQDVVYTICPITSQQEPVWEQGARNFIFALALGMWEDLLDGVCESKQFNLHSLYKNVSDYGTEGGVSMLAEYLSSARAQFSKAAGIASTVLSAQDKQLTSYLSTAQNYIVGFADSGIRRLTSGNDVDTFEFDEKPTALFIKIPDEKENRHFLVTLFITQLYKMLVEKARSNFRCGETKDEELKRTVYFLMDEFGNLPKFPSMRKILAVGASRKIYMMPIIQSYAQLDVIYGREDAAIIRDNCNIKIFIGSNDNGTIKEFSELCGKTKQRHISFGDGNDIAHFNVNTSAESVPLIYPSELEKLNSPPDHMGNAIVLAFGKNPIRAKFEPVVKQGKLYSPADGVPENDVEPQVFDEAAHYYNFATRSLYVARSGEFAKAQFDEAQKTVAEFVAASALSESPKPFDPLDGADEKLMPMMMKIKNVAPGKVALALEKAFFDHDVAGIIDACGIVVEYASAMNKRFVCSEAIKLKRIVTQLAAYAPLKKEKTK